VAAVVSSRFAGPCGYQLNVIWNDNSTETSSDGMRPDQIGLICAPIAIMLGGG
jgi:hypothetical protein